MRRNLMLVFIRNKHATTCRAILIYLIILYLELLFLIRVSFNILLKSFIYYLIRIIELAHFIIRRHLIIGGLVKL